ncbi:MAG: hypothetical protein ACRD2Q_07810 [Terriglobales bacterium]
MRMEPNGRRFLRRGRASRQSGYALLVILLALAFLLIAMTRSAPDVAHQIKREREQELIERGTQYARAIGRFYRKFGRYPSRIEELDNTNNIRFLRRRYKDPMTPGGEWRFVRFGEARLGSRGGSSAPGGIGTPAGGLQAPAGGAPQPGGPSPARASDSLSGKKFGGGPIVGVASQSTASSIRERDGKAHYNEWEFVYDSSLDPNARQPGQPGQPGRPGQPTKQPGGSAGQPQQPPAGTPDR